MANPVLKSVEQEIVQNNSINGDLFQKFDVKRGLRNADGSGVLAGLSKISSVIGTKKIGEDTVPVDGELRYRGIPIGELAEKVTRLRFESSVFLLLVGRLPNDKELADLHQFFAENRQVPGHIVEHLIKAIPSQHLMNLLQTTVSALYTLDSAPETLDAYDNFIKSLVVLAKLPALTAYGYLNSFKKSNNFVVAPAEMNIAEAFLYMLREGKAASRLETETLDLCLMLHAEHGGGNNSTFAARVVTSTETDMYATVVAGLASLKGPLHGGANKEVMDMMADIKANVKQWDDRDEVAAYLARIIRKEVHDKSGKIYGLGHAVYTKSDPRAIILKAKAELLANEKGRAKEYQLYRHIENEAPRVFHDVKGSSKIIAPNVDFFSGFVYDCLGIPEEVYTAMFAMARTAGWCAHRIEEILSGKRVIRPAYKFVG